MFYSSSIRILGKRLTPFKTFTHSLSLPSSRCLENQRRESLCHEYRHNSRLPTLTGKKKTLPHTRSATKWRSGVLYQKTVYDTRGRGGCRGMCMCMCVWFSYYYVSERKRHDNNSTLEYSVREGVKGYWQNEKITLYCLYEKEQNGRNSLVLFGVNIRND